MADSQQQPQEYKRLPIQINYKDIHCKQGQFISVPRFWIDAFFGPCTYYPNTTTKKGKPRQGERIPSSFWRYTLYLWRHVSVGRQRGGRGPLPFFFTLSLDGFPM